MSSKIKYGLNYETIFFIIMVLYMAMATPYTQSLSFPSTKNIITALIPLILILILIIRNYQRIKSISKFIKIFGLVFLWILLHFFKYGEIYPMTIFLIYNIILTFIISSIYKFNVFLFFEKSIVLFALISLFFWILYLIIPNILNVFFLNFNVLSKQGTLNSSILIFGLSASEDILGVRNSGFAQEPGYFAVYLILALYINLIINDFTILKNYNFWILLLALITTQSTTGYFATLPLIFLFLVNRSSFSSKFLVLLFSVIIIPIIFSLPFMSNKVEKYMYSSESHETAVSAVGYAEFNETLYVPQRIDGFVFELLNFIQDPFLGYGIQFSKNSYIAQNIGSSIYISNGNIKLFSKFGLFLAIFFLLAVYKTGKILTPKKPYSGGILFLSLYLFLSFSYDLIHVPILMSCWLYSCFYLNKNDLKLFIKQKKIYYES